MISSDNEISREIVRPKAAVITANNVKAVSDSSLTTHMQLVRHLGPHSTLASMLNRK